MNFIVSLNYIWESLNGWNHQDPWFGLVQWKKMRVAGYPMWHKDLQKLPRMKMGRRWNLRHRIPSNCNPVWRTKTRWYLRIRRIPLGWPGGSIACFHQAEGQRARPSLPEGNRRHRRLRHHMGKGYPTSNIHKCGITVCSRCLRDIFNEWWSQTRPRKIFSERAADEFRKDLSRFGRQEHTVIYFLFKLFANLTRKIVKSMGEIIIALYNTPLVFYIYKL